MCCELLCEFTSLPSVRVLFCFHGCAAYVLCLSIMNSHCIHIGMADSDVKSATFSSVPELKKIISTDKAPAAIGPYSQATVVGKTAYVSGCIAIIPGSSPPTLAEGGIEGQTRQLLDNMKAVVEACGGTMANVCKTTIFLHGDMSNCALRVSSNTQAAKCSVVSRPSFVRAATLCQFPS